MNVLGLSIVSILMTVSCDPGDASPELANAEVITATELQVSDEAELISDEIASIAEDLYAVDEIQATSKRYYVSDYLPDCATVTTVETDTTKEKTIDFGEGCELRNGNLVSGLLFISYAKDMEAATKTIQLTLGDFTYNGVAVEGGSTILRMRSNANGNPQSEVTGQYSGVWPDGSNVSFSRNRTREWIEGYGSGFWGDNVFSITGSSSFTGKLGQVLQKEITTPLRREWSCRFIVSGVLAISRNDVTATLDFGDGSCDALGTLTAADGETTEVRLRRFLKE